MGRLVRSRSTSARSSFRRKVCGLAGSALHPSPASPPIARQECRPSRALSQAPLSEPCGQPPEGAWGDASAPSGHPTADQIGIWARSYRSSASTHPLQVCRCVAGMYRPKAVARRASRLRRPRKDGSRQPSGFPLCGRSAGRRRAARAPGFPRDVAAIVEDHPFGREGPSAPNPSIRRGVPRPELQWGWLLFGQLLQPAFPSV
jgi:hypothetical protein